MTTEAQGRVRDYRIVLTRPTSADQPNGADAPTEQEVTDG